MYQFYYADEKKKIRQVRYQKDMRNEYVVEAIRPTMWEEHCLECSAPVCFNNCVHYLPRSDGRCMRFENGIYVQSNSLGCGGQSARIKFRKWANMMTIVFPAMLSEHDYNKMIDDNQKLGKQIRMLVNSLLPKVPKFTCIRIPEYIRRRKLRNLVGLDNTPTAFLFHGYSFENEPYHLIVEVMDGHTSVYKMSILLQPGENLQIIDSAKLSPACWRANYQVKVYPENDREAELEILWCDFVKGHKVISEQPAKNVKCLVWDLDNTIWDGTLIELEDAEKLCLRFGVLDVIKALDERGVLQSIASKNDYEAAWPIVEKLGLAEYFLYPQIHWNAKSGSMEQIANSLNIGIDSLALIDDSVFERNQVQSVWPQVRVYDAVEVSGLLDKAEFDSLVTEESKNRRKMYRAEENRNHLMAEDNSDTISFLKKCNLRLTLFSPEEQEEKSRCFELVVRTNQLNMSGLKYTQKEFEDVLGRKNHTNFSFSCEDDFGTYGIVGFGQYYTEKQNLYFTEFAMSCRVAGKYVESALFAELLRKENCAAGYFAVNKTKKNILLRRTLEDIGFLIIEDINDKISYKFMGNLKNAEIVQVNERK